MKSTVRNEKEERQRKKREAAAMARQAKKRKLEELFEAKIKDKIGEYFGTGNDLFNKAVEDKVKYYMTQLLHGPALPTNVTNGQEELVMVMMLLMSMFKVRFGF